jgi:hypothetical protein
LNESEVEVDEDEVVGVSNMLNIAVDVSGVIDELEVLVEGVVSENKLLRLLPES